MTDSAVFGFGLRAEAWDGSHVVEVPLPHGHVVRLDERDLPILSRKKWAVQQYKTPSGRVYRYLFNRQERLLFHRELLGALPGQFVDHIDGDGMNNARENLRICTHAENMRNRRPNAERDLPKGVSVKNGRFAAQIRAGAIRRFSGGYPTVEAAKHQYDEWARELHGVFAHKPAKAAA